MSETIIITESPTTIEIADVGVPGPAGTTDHGSLTGLADDDHPQYTTTAEAQALVDAHVNDAADAHDASAISFAPAGTIAATDVQAAIVEVAAEAGGGGAPTTADYLVGTVQAGLSAEIVVGATPGGELGGTWASPTVDATHSGSSHAAVQAAAEATAAAALAAHTTDATDAHDAEAVSVVPFATIASTNVQDALEEIIAEAVADLGPAVILAPASSARNVIQPTAGAVIAAVIKAHAAQSVSLMEFQDSAGTPVITIEDSGAFFIATGDPTKQAITIEAANAQVNANFAVTTFAAADTLFEVGPTGAVRITPSADVIAAIIKAHAAQTASIMEWHTSAGIVMASIDPDGSWFINPAAAGATALTARAGTGHSQAQTVITVSDETSTFGFALRADGSIRQDVDVTSAFAHQMADGNTAVPFYTVGPTGAVTISPTDPLLTHLRIISAPDPASDNPYLLELVNDDGDIIFAVNNIGSFFGDWEEAGSDWTIRGTLGFNIFRMTPTSFALQQPDGSGGVLEVVLDTPEIGVFGEVPVGQQTAASVGDLWAALKAYGWLDSGSVAPTIGGAPTGATYITQTPDAGLSAEQALSALATGLVKNTTGTGVLSIGAQGTDYYAPGGTDVAVADGGTGSSTAPGALTNLGVSAFIQTLLDDASAAAARTTLGIDTSSDNLFLSRYVCKR